MASRGEGEIKLFLEEHNLEGFYYSIINLNVHTLTQLQDIGKGKLKKIGMNKVEWTRILRVAKDAKVRPFLFRYRFNTVLKLFLL